MTIENLVEMKRISRIAGHFIRDVAEYSDEVNSEYGPTNLLEKERTMISSMQSLRETLNSWCVRKNEVAK